MKTFLVEYTFNSVECAMDVEAVDRKACREFIKNWRENRLRFRNGSIKIDSITLQTVKRGSN